MSVARTIGYALLGTVVGAVAGGVIGLLAGLAYTELAHVSGFEGYQGYVVAYWMLAGIVIGLLAGPFGGLRLARKQPRR